MRNLKRVLSLALAVVMVIGMMVMGAGAADFTDKAEITYTEAVDVAAALGLINGIEAADGTYSFNPDGILTREGAAKLICYMLMGPENAEMLVATQTFSDVAASRWSAPYISYCVSLGYIAGNGDGTFNPTGKLTGIAFAKLLLCALGYDAEIEGYVNNKNWATNIGSDAVEAGLNIAGVDLNAQLTREQAAQMILNTLKAPMVKYDTKGSTISVNGAEIVFGSSTAEYVTTALAKEQRISDQTLTNTNESVFTVEFGEKYFPNLYLDSDDSDVFGRPANTWTYKTEDIGTYVNYDLLVKEFTAGTTYGALYSALGGSAATLYTVDSYVDGAEGSVNPDAIIRNNVTNVPGTARGVLTQVFVNHDDEIVTIVSINTYVATVASVTDSSVRYVTLSDLYDDEVSLTSYDVVSDTLQIGDVVSYTAAWIGNNFVRQSLKVLDADVNGTLTEWIGTNYKEDTANFNFAVDDESYDYSFNYRVDSINNKVADFTIDVTELNVYMDDYGYALYIDEVNQAPDKHAVLIGYGQSNQYGSETRGVTLLMPDGTKKEVIASLAGGKTWPVSGASTEISSTGSPKYENLVTDYIGDLVTYSVLPNGTYVLTVADLYDTANPTDVDFTNGKSWLTADEDGDSTVENYYTTSNTVFFVATPGIGGISYKVYTGYSEMPSLDNAAVTGIAMAAQNNVVKAVYITASGLATDYDLDAVVYMNSDTVYTNDLGDYYIMRAIVDGEITSVKVAHTAATGMTKGDVVAMTDVVKNPAGVITGFTPVAPETNQDAGETYMSAAGIKAANGVVVGIYNSTDNDGSYKYWAYTEDTLVYVINTNGTITKSSVASIATDDNDVIYFTINDVEKTLETVIIKKVNPTDPTPAPAPTVLNSASLADTVTETTLTVNYVDGVETAGAAIEAALTANEYTVTEIKYSAGAWTAKATKGVVTYEWTATVTAWYTVKVDGELVAYMNSGTAAAVPTAQGTNAGTGFIADITTDGTYAYAAYAATTSVGVNHHVEITNGYVSVAGTTFTGGTNSVTAGTVTHDGYAKANSTATVKVVTAANASATKGASAVTLTCTGGTAPAAQALTLDQAKAGATLTFTITTAGTNITAVAVAVTDAT